MCEPGSREIRAPRETDCGINGSAEPLRSRRRPMSTSLLWNLSTYELPVVIEDGMSGRGAADKAESLAGCKSPYRQLPVFGRLAYPGRAAATTHERPGRKSPSCPAAVFAAVGTIRGASKLGGRNITKYLQPRNEQNHGAEWPAAEVIDGRQLRCI